LTKYRTFPGPGRYLVSARFDLTNEHGADGRNFNVPVETKFVLTVLPRTPARVTTVLDRLFSRCEQTSRVPLQETIEVICEFGQDAAVPGLGQFAQAGNTELRQAAIRGLGTIPGKASLNVLLAVEPDPVVREAALLALGAFTDDRAVQCAVAALADADAKVRTAAAAALGQMKTDTAIAALLRRFDATDSLDEAAAILAALGATGADEPYRVVSAALGREEDVLRRAAVSAVVRFAPADAAAALRLYAEDEDMNFRETVIRTLAETLRVPIDAEQLAPVIRSRRGTNTIGDAPRLLRLYTDDKAAPTLLGCLDFDDASIRHYYNMTIIQNQLSCQTGLAIPWLGDLNRDGTPEEEQQNRETLARLKVWLDEYRQKPWSEPPEPWRLPHDQGQLTWGPENNGLRLRARLNSSVWPLGLPQVITVDAINNGGSVVFDERPEVIEVEVDGEWYAHDPDIEPTVCGEWHAYKGQRWHSYQLSPHWKRITDSQPLELTPGPHATRIRIVRPPGDNRSHMLISLPLEFRVVTNPTKSD
ncbi:MAG: HEAT repeat domain-containing protein, partial [Planctomycetota bacterium]|nr:HEAT repeat domain-containing protein [Planctomycetota bacterium]